MDISNYEKHVLQKHRLAIAIAVLKNKPNDVSIENYIIQLKNDLEQEKMNVDDLDYTICSEDFNISEDTNIYDNTKSDTTVTEPNKTDKHFIKCQDISNNYDKDNTDITNSIDILKEINEIDSLGLTVCVEDSILPEVNKECHDSKTKENDTQLVDVEINNTETKILDTQQTVIYDYAKLLQSQSLTHVSQSQDDDKRFEILEKYVLGITKRKKPNKLPEDKPETIEDKTIKNKVKTIDEKFDTNVNINKKSNNVENPTQIIDTNEITNTENFDTMPIVGETEINNISENRNFAEIPKETNSFNNNEDDIINTEPKIPFSVLEKLNRIKQELNRKFINIGCSLESGYTSDTQSQKLSASNIDSYLINAGETLLSYLMEIQTVNSMYDLIQDMARVFGEFIDKLHSDEVYPQFLETVTDNIKQFLKEIYASNSCGLDAIPHKNQSISRLLLLNYSININIYTIEQILHYLEGFYTKITSKEDLYEITNTIDIENVCYVFYVLEVLLQRYTQKNKNLAPSQKEEIGTRDILLKKSSITDIWKSKWNPSKGNTEKQNGAQNTTKCIKEKCGETLKRIVVDCMEGYSLISYGALQCLNLVQE